MGGAVSSMGGLIDKTIGGAGDFVGDLGTFTMSSGGGLVGDVLGSVGNAASGIINTVKNHPLEAALLAAGGYYFAPELGAWYNSATGEAIAGSATGAEAGAATTNIGAGLGSSGSGLQATGSLGLTGGNTANLAAMGSAQGLTGASTAGTALGATGGALTAGGLGAGLGYGSAALGAGALGASSGLGLGSLGTAGLISGGLGLAGGLLGGASAADASSQAAAQQAALAQQTASMGKFQPVGTTTRFGTSSFTVDPVTGALKANYIASPLAQGYQNQLAGMTGQGLLQGQQLQGLASQYLGESPEAVRQRYVQQQSALLAPQQEQQLAGIRNNLFQTGRTGLATGATSAGGLAATNPEMTAYYNSLANQQRQIAAGADTAAQQQIQFGQQLAGQAYQPFTAGFGAQTALEQAAQQPLEISTNLANLASTAGARQASNYATAMGSSIASQQAANSYNPWATALQGAASNPLTGYGLMKAFGG